MEKCFLSIKCNNRFVINENTFVFLSIYSCNTSKQVWYSPIDGLTIATGRLPLCSTRTCSATALVKVYVLGRLPIILRTYCGGMYLITMNPALLLHIVGQVVMLQIRIREVRGSNIERVIGCPDWGLSWLYLVYPDEFRNHLTRRSVPGPQI